MADIEMTGKKVCFVSPAAYPLFDRDNLDTLAGGAEAQLFTIGRELAKAGLEVHFIVGDHGQSDCVVRDNVIAHRGSFRYMGGSKKYLLMDWLRFVRLVWSIHADYYFIKVPHHLLFILGVITKLFSSKVVYIGQKDSDFDVPLLLKKEGLVGWWMYKMGMHMATAIVAQTHTQQDGFQRVFNRNSKVIRNVLTLEKDDILKKSDHVLWVGNSSEDKQPHIVLELARMLPKVSFKMIMGMSPSRPDDAFIREKLSELSNIEYLGTVPFSEISKYYKEAKVFISTSRCEGFPNTFLQAWQYRTPVVSLMIDPDGIIEAYELGRVSGSIEKMVEDIEEMINDPSVSESLGNNAIEYAYKHHSLESAVSGYCSIIYELGASIDEDVQKKR